MNRTTQLRRKLVYLAVLVLMLIPLYLLGQPAGGGGEGGGQLAKMRDAYDISESDLGEISPASETMKLASLGMRGVAASLLWKKSHDYRVMHEWDRLKATLNNIALLQPHFDKVWEFQAHNLAYNVSSEFDDYRQRYEMVREGTEFLTKGVKQNRKAPRLVWYTGWFYGQKMGMSDEKRQFRRLFADDEVLHEALLDQGIAVDSPEARGPDGKPDNWLVGRLWLNSGYDLVESGIKIRRQTPINFYETGPKWRIKHAEAIESEGVLDERAQNAWQMASADWRALGNRSIPTTASFTIRLGQIEELKRQREDVLDEFRELTGEAYTNAEMQRIETLSPVIQEALLTPADQRNKSQQSIAEAHAASLVPDLATVARNAGPKVRLKAMQMVEQVSDLDERILKTNGYRNQINYPYWETLALAEQEERTVRARRLTFEAEKANAEAELDKAIKLYEESFEVWAEIFDDYPILVIDDSAQDLFDSIRRYKIATDSDEIAEDFPLKTFVEMMGEYGQVDAGMYEEVRKNQQDKLAARKRELADEEKRREAEAAEAETKTKMKQTASKETDSKQSDDSKADAKKSDAKMDDVKSDDTKPNEKKSNDSQDGDKKEKNAEKTDDKEADKPDTASMKPASETTGDPKKVEDKATTIEKADKNKADEDKVNDDKAETKETGKTSGSDKKEPSGSPTERPDDTVEEVNPDKKS